MQMPHTMNLIYYIIHYNFTDNKVISLTFIDDVTFEINFTNVKLKLVDFYGNENSYDLNDFRLDTKGPIVTKLVMKLIIIQHYIIIKNVINFMLLLNLMNLSKILFIQIFLK